MEPPIIDAPPPKEKTEIELSDGRILKITDIEVRYVGEDGKPLTATEFLEKLIGALPSLYESEQSLREIWSKPETREELLGRMGKMRFDDEQLQTLREMFNAVDSDIFDILTHISFSKDIMTRHQRSVKTKEHEQFFAMYENLKARDFLHFVLSCYEKDGVKELQREKLGNLIKLNKLGTTKDAAQVFGGTEKLIEAFYELQKVLYAS